MTHDTYFCIVYQHSIKEEHSLRKPDVRCYSAVPINCAMCHLANLMFSAGHTERAMLYHELEDGMYSVTSYFFAKVILNKNRISSRGQSCSMLD